MSCYAGKQNRITMPVTLKEDEMDRTQNRPEVITAPTVIIVEDRKRHVISRTIVNYDQVEEILSQIKDIEERNNWGHRTEVLPSARYFLSDLAQKDRVP